MAKLKYLEEVSCNRPCLTVIMHREDHIYGLFGLFTDVCLPKMQTQFYFELIHSVIP